MFADMVGFTELMGRDEDVAREQRDRQRNVVEGCVEQFGGHVRQFYGDGTLSVFGSAVEAAKCAVAIQEELRRSPEVSLRIGIHTGDIVDEGEGVYGDGVNVASRIESLASPGGVLVSDKVFDEIKNHRDLEAISLGTARLKNVKRPVEVFALTNEGLAVPEPGHLGASAASLAHVGRASRLTTVAVGVSALLVLALGLMWVSSRAESELGAPLVTAEDRSAPSIAVLPFRNMSAEAENAAFFAEGIHDDILTQLSKVGSLDVIARTSVMRYAGSETPIPMIGRELGVATVLEGGVQRTGDRIRLNVQLIDTETDVHLWADTYDRELTAENVFAIQTQVAEAIAEELRTVLTGEERRALANVPTESLEAYDLYLYGAATLRRQLTPEGSQIAEEAFLEAVRIDPGFAVAFARLAYVHLDMYWNAFDRSELRLDLARQALQSAEAIDPDHPEVLVARGYYHYWGFREYSEAQAAFASAQRELPGDARLYEARGYVLRRSGSWLDAARDLETAVSLDPLNAELIRALGQIHSYMGDYDLAQEVLDRALTVEPGHWTARYDRGLVDVLRDGSLGRLKGAVEDTAPNPALAFTQWWIAYLEGDDSRAFEISNGFTRPLELQASIHPPSLLDALLHRSKGRRAQAMAAADSARTALEELVQRTPEDPRVHAALGTAYALLGLREDALRAGGEAVRLLPVDRDAMDGPEYLLHLARIHALLGDEDEAVAVIARLLSAPSRNSLTALLLEPAFSSLRDHPELQTIDGR
jgi:TolB-like protein/Flp pilus assembly protein TadD